MIALFGFSIIHASILEDVAKGLSPHYNWSTQSSPSFGAPEPELTELVSFGYISHVGEMWSITPRGIWLLSKGGFSCRRSAIASDPYEGEPHA